MKFQEVILRAMSKQITWTQAAEICGMSDRNMRRYRNQLEKGGYDGLIERRTQRRENLVDDPARHERNQQ